MLGILLLHDDNCETADVPHEIPIEHAEHLVDEDTIVFAGKEYVLTRRSPRLTKSGSAGNFHGKFAVQLVFEAEIVPPVETPITMEELAKLFPNDPSKIHAPEVPAVPVGTEPTPTDTVFAAEPSPIEAKSLEPEGPMKHGHKKNKPKH